MELIRIAALVLIGLGIYNVWLLRAGKPTSWRGGTAASMKEEFTVYGLPDWAMPVVGFLKLGLATALLAGIWVPALVVPAAVGLAVLMLGAIAMHLKVRDPLARSVPALTMLALCVVAVMV